MNGAAPAERRRSTIGGSSVSLLCYAEAITTAIFYVFALLPLVLVLLIVWQVISSLNEISRSVADIAMTLRRIESKGSPSSLNR